MLPPIVTYWHNHMQTPNPQTPSLLGFTAIQAALLLTLRSHSKVSDKDETKIRSCRGGGGKYRHKKNYENQN